jgi:hypothetical protein
MTQRRANYAEQARGGRWVMDITGRHAILRDAQGRSVLAGSNISRVRLKGVPVVGFVMAQADEVQPLGDPAGGGAERLAGADRPIYIGPAGPLAEDTREPSGESDPATRDSPDNQQVVQYANPAAARASSGSAVLKPGLATEENIRQMATTLTAEANGYSEAAQIAVGWTILNRMIRNGRDDVATIVRAYSKEKPTPSAEALELARKLLNGEIPDNSGGATHFYSPQSMPKEGQKTGGSDVGGGLEQVPGMSKRNYRPRWALTFEERSVPGTQPMHFRFFRHPGNGKVR